MFKAVQNMVFKKCFKVLVSHRYEGVFTILSGEVPVSWTPISLAQFPYCYSELTHTLTPNLLLRTILP